MRILFVEDEVTLAQEFIESLRKQGESVDALTNGDMALQVSLEYHGEYDLIVLDSSLPKLDGSAVCKGIRDAGIEIPILMLVTEEDLEQRKEIFECGADDYLVKPFSTDELMLRIGALMGRQGVLAPVVLNVADLTLNILDHTLEGSSQKVDLTLTELELLEYFFRNTGKVISRHELWQELWKEEDSPKSNIVNAHIKNVRKKLREAQGSREAVRIETIRGIGFRLRENARE